MRVWCDALILLCAVVYIHICCHRVAESCTTALRSAFKREKNIYISEINHQDMACLFLMDVCSVIKR